MKDSNFIIGRSLSKLSMALILLSGIVNTMDELSSLQIPILFAGVFVALFNLSTIKKIKLISYKYYIIPTLCLFSGIISGIVLVELSLLLNAVALFVVFFVFTQIYSINEFLDDIDDIVMVIFVFVTLGSLLINPIKLTNYTGLFYNLNALGGVYCSFFSYFLATIKENSKTIKIKLVFCMISFFFVIVSSSRGAFVSTIFIFFVWLYLSLKSKGHFDNKKLIKTMVALSFIGLIIYCSPLYSIIYDSIIVKFINKSRDISAGRSDIWLTAWAERSFFGHGRMYFSGYKTTINHTIVRFGAHNTIVSILGQYGLMGAISYTLLFLFFLIITIKNYKKNKSYKPILLTLSFMALSLFEGMLMKVSMFFMYYGITCCVKNKEDDTISLILENITYGDQTR